MNVPICRWFKAMFLGLVMPLSAEAANPPPTQLFYIPFAEDQSVGGL